MKNEKTCELCGSTSISTLCAGPGYNTVLWCSDCGHEEHTPKFHQKECEACDQVITLGAPNNAVRFCFDCIEKVEAYERMDAEEESTIIYDYYADPKV